LLFFATVEGNEVVMAELAEIAYDSNLKN